MPNIYANAINSEATQDWDDEEDIETDEDSDDLDEELDWDEDSDDLDENGNPFDDDDTEAELDPDSEENWNDETDSLDAVYNIRSRERDDMDSEESFYGDNYSDEDSYGNY